MLALQAVKKDIPWGGYKTENLQGLRSYKFNKEKRTDVNLKRENMELIVKQKMTYQVTFSSKKILKTYLKKYEQVWLFFFKRLLLFLNKSYLQWK